MEQPTTPSNATPRRPILTDAPVAALAMLAGLAVYFALQDHPRAATWGLLAAVGTIAALLWGLVAQRRYPLPGLEPSKWLLVIVGMIAGTLLLGAHIGLGSAAGRASQMTAVLGFGLLGASQMVLAPSRPRGGRGLRITGIVLLVIAGMKLVIPPQ